MAELPFVDTHFHLHDLKHPDLKYSWLEWDAVHGYLGNIDAIKPIHYWIEDYIAEIRFANVPKAIHVQAALGIKDPVDETKWLQAFADKTGYPAYLHRALLLLSPKGVIVADNCLQAGRVLDRESK